MTIYEYLSYPFNIFKEAWMAVGPFHLLFQ